MHGLQRTKVCVLSVAVLSICACVTTDNRLSEDLQTDGFIVCICDDEEESTGPTVKITDAESIEMFAQWFRHRPRASGDLETMILQQAIAGEFTTTIRIETTRLRVNLPMFADLPVELETRAAASDDWSKNSSWKARKEDMELTRWLIGRITAEYKSEAFHGEIIE